MADVFTDEGGMVMIYSTVVETDEAKAIAKTLVEEKLVACANIFQPHLTVYHWQGKVAQSDEVGVLFKTSEAVYESAVERLRELHPYDVPVIVWWGADAVPETMAWLKTATS